MRTALVIALLLNVPLVLSACASTNTMDNQASKAPLSRHDRLWNSHLNGW
ncbi:hypothetical protein [Candidatus Odyssella thessalonicensis]|nr:hypothetical protein [Candidatus Odyssella thessalonicensis]